MENKPVIKWLKAPEEHNYPAALSYLSLMYKESEAKKLADQLKTAAISSFKAKDIFRASSLSLLGISNAHVKRDEEKIENGSPLSPVLLVRDSANGKVIIADGYHRLCAVYAYDENALIPCKIV